MICVHICHRYYQSIVTDHKIPEISTAPGANFGFYKSLGLTFPNSFERTILSTVRLYHQIMKISKNNHIRNDFTHSKFLSHCIAFGYDDPTIANNLFGKVYISEFI